MGQVKKLPSGVRMSGRLRSVLLAHAQGHPYSNEAGISDFELAKQMEQYTCRSVCLVNGLGPVMYHELMRVLAQFHVKLACGCPCDGEEKKEA